MAFMDGATSDNVDKVVDRVLDAWHGSTGRRGAAMVGLANTRRGGKRRHPQHRFGFQYTYHRFHSADQSVPCDRPATRWCRWCYVCVSCTPSRGYCGKLVFDLPNRDILTVTATLIGQGVEETSRLLNMMIAEVQLSQQYTAIPDSYGADLVAHGFDSSDVGGCDEWRFVHAMVLLEQVCDSLVDLALPTAFETVQFTSHSGEGRIDVSRLLHNGGRSMTADGVLVGPFPMTVNRLTTNTMEAKVLRSFAHLLLDDEQFAADSRRVVAMHSMASDVLQVLGTGDLLSTDELYFVRDRISPSPERCDVVMGCLDFLCGRNHVRSPSTLHQSNYHVSVTAWKLFRDWVCCLTEEVVKEKDMRCERWQPRRCNAWWVPGLSMDESASTPRTSTNELQEPIVPDIMYADSFKSVCIVGDVKYRHFDRADLQRDARQMFLYAAKYETLSALLVYWSCDSGDLPRTCYLKEGERVSQIHVISLHQGGEAASDVQAAKEVLRDNIAFLLRYAAA